jgi:hypothetical protein
MAMVKSQRDTWLVGHGRVVGSHFRPWYLHGWVKNKVHDKVDRTGKKSLVKFFFGGQTFFNVSQQPRPRAFST